MILTFRGHGQDLREIDEPHQRDFELNDEIKSVFIHLTNSNAEGYSYRY